MICKNCGAEIKDNSGKCDECGVYVNQLKMEVDAGTGIFAQTFSDTDDELSGTFLVLENGVKFNLSKNDFSGEIDIGRKDIDSNPVIDLGPYDKGPYVSRKQGIFNIEENSVYFTDVSKNGTYLNDNLMEKNVKVKLKNGDKFRFGKINGEIKII